MKIRKLENEFTKKNVLYIKERELPEIYVYKCIRKDCPIYYEIFLKKISVINDYYKQYIEGDYDMFERYPNDESFGKWALTTYKINDIEKCINKLIKN